MKKAVQILMGCFLLVFGNHARAAGRLGEFVQSNNLGINVATVNLENGATKNITQAGGLSQFVGLHYYIADRVRLGVNLQFTE
jgi:hypothetical protein